MDKYKFIVDLGTTTIDACLYNGAKVVAKRSCKNSQSLYGSDVINRILNSSRNRDVLTKLKKLVVNDIESLLNWMLNETKTDIKAVDTIMISGNTTMISILLKDDISSLGVHPFKTPIDKTVCMDSKELFIIDNLEARVYLSGCSSAFIGGDILAGIHYIEKTYTFNNNELLIDLGTNGEMVLKVRDEFLSTSTACGPAFENCTRRQGVYGANVIDSISMLLRTGNISKEGLLKEDFFSSGIDINGIHIDMDIIHSILLAKSAVCSGIICLVEGAGLRLNDIKRVYLAGGFGFYLNIKNAVCIGLIPKTFEDKIQLVGNSSLEGSLMLVKDETYDVLDKYSTLITNYQLADDEKYKNKLIENMVFKPI